jgi:hypothetical protein
MRDVESLYKYFFTKYNQPNPCDINTPEKLAFFKSLEWEDVKAMQRARKKGELFTKLSWFQSQELNK